jgi:hypothetical protein
MTRVTNVQHLINQLLIAPDAPVVNPVCGWNQSCPWLWRNALSDLIYPISSRPCNFGRNVFCWIMFYPQECVT